jgi:hypothetical protein
MKLVFVVATLPPSRLGGVQSVRQIALSMAANEAHQPCLPTSTQIRIRRGEDAHNASRGPLPAVPTQAATNSISEVCDGDGALAAFANRMALRGRVD